MKNAISTLFLLTPVAIIAAAFRARQSPFDFALLLAGGLLALGCIAIWLLQIFGSIETSKSPVLTIAALIFSPLTVYAVAVLFGLRFFFADIHGWPRAVYLVGAVAGLSPLIMIAGIGLVMAAGSALRR
jgi:hypothetical protein